MTKNKKVLSIILGVITLLALSLGIVVLRTANFAYADTASFKAVFDETDSDNKTLTFYYDAVDHSGENITVYDLKTDAKCSNDWGYEEKRGEVKAVIFDESIQYLHGLTSTAFMLKDMKKAEDIKGAEYLDVSTVTNMNSMFASFGSDVNTFNAVPDVSEWDTANVKSINNIFFQYGLKSTFLEAVPNVENWDTSSVENMAGLFNFYGPQSSVLDFTLDLTGWNLNNVDNSNNVFMSAGSSNSNWNVIIPDTSSGKTNDFNKWYVGNNGVLTIVPANGKRFTLVECYTIINATPETYNEQNGGYIIVKEQSPQGKTITVEVFANEGYVLSSLKYNDGADHDITEKKSFIMGDKAVKVTAEFGVLSFKAVLDETDGSLTFYYDAESHSGEKKTVFNEFKADAKYGSDWGYHEKRASVKSVIFDKSIENFHGLTSTASMLYDMTSAENITGEEYLDVSNVTDMSCMFQNFGYNVVPNVENWNTEKVTNMSYMFASYGNSSTSLNVVPDVSNWNTAQVTAMKAMFSSYGYSSTSLNVVPDVSNWNTAQVKDMQNMFFSYGWSSTSLNVVPDVSNWNTAKVTNMQNMFTSYGHDSPSLNVVPDVSNWNTAKVTTMMGMFNSYGYRSASLNVAPNVENWNTAQVTNMQSMFNSYGWSSTELTAVPNVEKWNTAQVADITNMLFSYGWSSKKLNFTLDLSGWNLSNVNGVGNLFTNAGTNTPTWKVIIPATSGEKTNDVDKWYVGNGSQFIATAYNKSFTLAYDIVNNAPETDKGQNGGYIVIKNTAIQGERVTVEVVANEGWVLSSLKYNDGVDHDITEEKSFIMGDKAVKVTAEFDKLSFKAVLDETDGSLTFYYDAESHSGEKKTVFNEFKADAKYGSDWGYDEKRASVKSVIFDKSIENFHGLTSTASMLFNMEYAENITGEEYLDVSNVTDMSCMFQNFGLNVKSFNVVPNVENWNTAKVTNMSCIFQSYGFNSTKLTAVPNVEKWNTAQVTDMTGMFQSYGWSSTELTAVPNVEKWNTAQVTNMTCMFQSYGWSSTELTAVPNVEKWNTAQVTNIMSMFSIYGCSSENLNFTLDLSGWNLSSVNNCVSVFFSVGNLTSKWEVKIPETSSGKTNTTAEWYVGDGTKYISPTDGRSFTLVECYTIINATPETYKEQNGGYIIVKEQSPQGKTITVEVFANEGCVLSSLKYNDGADHDITEEKSFTMGDKAVKVTAEFELCTDHVDSDEDGICDKCGISLVPCEHKNTEVIYELIDGNENCIAKLVCTDCQDILLTETVATEIIEDTKATCTEKAKGHYKATFTNAVLGVKETDKDSVEYGTPLGHNFVNYVCERCHIEDLDGARLDFTEIYIQVVNTRPPTYLQDAVDNIAYYVNSATTLAEIQKAMGSVSALIHVHTFSPKWSYSETHHWHDNLCDNCDVVTGFGTHTFDGGVKNGNGITYTCICGYSYTVYDPFIETESDVISETIKYTGYSLTLSSDISINFYMELTEEQASSGEMRFIIGDREEIVKAKLNDNGYYFRCPLTSLEMATKVTAEFSYNEDKLVKEYSVIDYIDEIVKGNYNEKLKALCKAIANYGYYAQINLASMHQGVTIGEGGYKEMCHYDELDVDGAKTGLESFGFVDDCKNDNITGVSRSLSLDDKVAMNFYITVKEGYTLTKDKISVSEGKKFTLTEVDENQYRITVLDIEAVNFGTDYDIVIDGEKITTSVLSYANKIVHGSYSESSINVMTALYEYYLAAIDYKVV